MAQGRSVFVASARGALAIAANPVRLARALVSGVGGDLRYCEKLISPGPEPVY